MSADGTTAARAVFVTRPPFITSNTAHGVCSRSALPLARAHAARSRAPCRWRPQRKRSAFLTAHTTDAARACPVFPAASVSPHVSGLCTDSSYHSAPAAEIAACVSLKRRARASCVSEKRRSTSSIKARVEMKVEKAPWHVVAIMR